MGYLSRDAAPFSEELWRAIDDVVVGAARATLTGRRFLHLYGPLGPGARSIEIDEAGAVEETTEDGLITTSGRKFVGIPALYADFSLLARDLAASEAEGKAPVLTAAHDAAAALARKEDAFLFFGSAAHGFEGIFTAQGAARLPKKDWATGENAFSDIAAAVAQLSTAGVYGAYSLVLSLDLYVQLQRIQPGTGLLELDRIAKLLGGRVYTSPVLGAGRAALVCAEAGNLDLVVGQDIAAAYLEQKDLNHSLRIIETLLLRIKRKDAIVLFE